MSTIWISTAQIVELIIVAWSVICTVGPHIAPANQLCYTWDHANAAGMWNKPREITNYQYLGNGFEIAYETLCSGKRALKGLEFCSVRMTQSS